MIASQNVKAATLALERMFQDRASNPGTRLVQTADSKAMCFGQQLNSKTAQRGIHGTAAAMAVVNSSSVSGAEATFLALAHYCENRAVIEQSLGADQAKSPVKIREDDCNVVKLSEILLALADAPTQSGVSQYAATLCQRLMSGRTDQQGNSVWSYYLNGPSTESALLPTSWAVLALSAHKEARLRSQFEYLHTKVEDIDGSDEDLSVRVFTLYVLTFARTSPYSKKDLRGLFLRYWTKMSSLLSQDLESNIEYLSGGVRVHYVRVPWQLYLLACAAELSPYRAYASPRAQARMQGILDQVGSNQGLVYAHSGRVPSTRTNAIAHEVLVRIWQSLEGLRLPLHPFFVWHRLVDLARAKAVRVTAVLLVLAIVALTSYAWWRDPEHSWADLGPNLLTTILALVLAPGARK